MVKRHVDEFPQYEKDPATGELVFRRQGSDQLLTSPSAAALEKVKSLGNSAAKASLINQAAQLKHRGNAQYIQRLTHDPNVGEKKFQL